MGARVRVGRRAPRRTQTVFPRVSGSSARRKRDTEHGARPRAGRTPRAGERAGKRDRAWTYEWACMADPGCRAATCGELKAGGDKGERRDASEDVSRRCWRERERRISERSSTAGRAKFLKFFSFFPRKFFSEKSHRSGAAATRLVHPSPPRRRLRVRFPHRVGDRTFSRDLDRDRPRAPRAALAPNPFFPSLRSPSRRRRRSPSLSRERERSRLRSVRSTRPPPSRRMGSPHLSTGTRPLAPPRPPPRHAGFDR